MPTDANEGPPSRPSTRRNNDGVLLPATMVGGGCRGNADGPQTMSATRPPRTTRRSASSRPLGSAPRHKVPRASTQHIGTMDPRRSSPDPPAVGGNRWAPLHESSDGGSIHSAPVPVRQFIGQDPPESGDEDAAILPTEQLLIPPTGDSGEQPLDDRNIDIPTASSRDAPPSPSNMASGDTSNVAGAETNTDDVDTSPTKEVARSHPLPSMVDLATNPPPLDAPTQPEANEPPAQPEANQPPDRTTV